VELTPAVTKRPRSADASPGGSPAPNAWWGDSEDGDTTSSAPGDPGLLLEDQVPIGTAAQGCREEPGARKPPSPTPQGWGRRAVGTGAVTRAQESDDMSEESGDHEPAKLIRQQKDKALDAKNDTSLGAIFGAATRTVSKTKANQPIAKWLDIYIGDPNAQATDKFTELPKVTAVLEQLQPVAQNPQPERTVLVQA
jgi:hypothetical protein